MTAMRVSEIRFEGSAFLDPGMQCGALAGSSAFDLMRKAAEVSAASHAGGSVTQCGAGRVDFFRPVAVGQEVELLTRVEPIGRFGLAVTVDVIAVSSGGHCGDLVMRGQFELSAINSDGRARPLVDGASAVQAILQMRSS